MSDAPIRNKEESMQQLLKRTRAMALIAFGAIGLCGTATRARALPTLAQLMADFEFSQDDIQQVRNGQLVRTNTKETSERELAAVMVFLVKAPIPKLLGALKAGPNKQNDPQVQAVTEISED